MLTWWKVPVTNERGAKILPHLSTPPLPTTKPQNTINKGDYTLAHYLIFTKLVSAEDDCPQGPWGKSKIGSTSPSLRLTNQLLWCLLKQMPEVICAKKFQDHNSISKYSVTKLHEWSIQSILSPDMWFLQHLRCAKIHFNITEMPFLMIHLNTASNSKIHTS